MASQRVFRETFLRGKELAKDLTYYFPGHMNKGLHQMQAKLTQVDCILEVHDGRIPLSGRNPRFKEVINVKPRALILNKSDLSDNSRKKKFEAKLKAEGIQHIVHTNCKTFVDQSIKVVLPGIIENLVHSSPRYNRQNAEDYNVMVIGVPNVGKSSLINSMRRTHSKKGKATPVGATAGVTKSVMQRIKISNTPPIYMIDSPGILNPQIRNVETGLKLALCATMKDHLVGEDIIVDYMLYWLNKHEKMKYVEYFGLKEPTEDVNQFLAHIAITNKLTQKRKSTTGQYVIRPNFTHAAQIALKAFRMGDLGRVNLDVDLLKESSQS